MSNEFEIRSSVHLETDGQKLKGYAAVFDSRSHDLGGFVEVIRPNAFDRTLRENPDVLALSGHDTNRVLGRTAADTLILKPDSHGLYFEITPPDTSYARDLVSLVKRGDVSGASFRFRPYSGGEHWDVSRSPALRTLTSVQLSEVSIVSSPAYPSTSVALRALDKAKRDRERGFMLRKMQLQLSELE